MEIMEILSSRWLEVAVAVYLIGMMLYGHYRGFIKIAVSAMSLFITLFAARVAIPQAAAWLEHNTAVYETMKESALKASGLDEKMEEMAQTAGLAGKAGERAVIESLEIPDQIKKLLIENNNGEIYQEMGVQIFEDYVGKYLADRVIRVLCVPSYHHSLAEPDLQTADPVWAQQDRRGSPGTYGGVDLYMGGRPGPYPVFRQRDRKEHD